MRLLKKLNLSKNLLVLISGSILGQLLTILISPITTRLYTPTDFGNYTLIITSVSIFGPILSLKYDMNIVNAKNEEERKNLIIISFLISVLLSLLISFGYYYFFLVSNFKESIMILLFLLLISYSVSNILVSYNNYTSEYSLIAKVTVRKSIVQSIGLLVAGLLKFGYTGMTITQVISQLSGIWVQSKGLRANKGYFRGINWEKMKSIMYKYRQQPLFNSWSALISTLSYSSINLFIGFVYSADYLGYYSLSYRMLGLPFMIISANVSKIFFKEASELRKRGYSILTRLKKNIVIMFAVIIPTMSLIFFTAPFLFSLIFGEDWVIAGYFVQLFIPVFSIRLIVDSFSSIYIIENKQHIEFFLQVSLILLELFSFLVLSLYSASVYESLAVLSLIITSVNVLNLVFIYRIVKDCEKND